MTDEVSPAATNTAATQAAAPVVPSPATVDAVAVPSVTPVIVEAKADAPVVETIAVEPVKVEEKKPATLLDIDVNKPIVEVKTDKPAEAKAVEPNKQDVSQSEKSAQLPSYETFKLPEGVTFDNEKLSEFTKELGELQASTKAEQAIMQAFGQKLVDRHIAELQRNIALVQDQAKESHNAKISAWDDLFRKDPEIGGNRQDTVLAQAASAIALAGNESQQKEFRQMLKDTGSYAHPAMIRILSNMQQKIDAYEKKYNSESGIKPLVPAVPADKPKGIANKMYGNMQK